MPTGTPDYGFIAPFPIRVDSFNTPRDALFSPPALYLLTHTHSDHTVGLSAKSFSSRVVCSPDARQMLLAMEPTSDRIAVDNGLKALRNRPYAHMKVDPVARGDGSVDYSMSRDLLLAVPLNTPRVFELNDKKSVTVTLIDANHCIGAVMFLVESDNAAILHTGDFRAEPAFLSSIRMNHALQRYLAPTVCFSENADSPTRPLDAIYLDTACMLRTHQVPTKADATDGLVQLMSHFPCNTRFFLNCWTWGYEDILKAVSSAFRVKIHVDRYKYNIFMKTSDPFLKALVSLDENVSRFHACERHDRCSQVDFPANTESIVYVNPIDLDIEQWSTYRKETEAHLKAGGMLTNLIVPLARHSPLPELQEFVRMFKPKSVVPNTLDPALHGVDYAAMISMFEDCLAPGGVAVMKDQMLSERISMGPSSLSRRPKAGALEPRNGLMVQLDNIVGVPGADYDVIKWTRGEESATRKMEILKSFLPDALLPALCRVFNIKKRTTIIAQDGTDYDTTDNEQSCSESLEFNFSSSPLAEKPGRMSSSRKTIAIAPTTPPALKRQLSLPGASPTATPKGSQLSKQVRKGDSPALILMKLGRTQSESEAHTLRTPLSSPSRLLKRKAIQQEPQQVTRKRMKTASHAERCFSAQTSLHSVDVCSQQVQEVRSPVEKKLSSRRMVNMRVNTATSVHSREGSTIPSIRSRVRVANEGAMLSGDRECDVLHIPTMPTVSRLTPRSSCLGSQDLSQQPVERNLRMPTINSSSRLRSDSKLPTSSSASSSHSKEGRSFPSKSLEAPEHDHSSDGSTSVVPDSQESSISTTSIVLRRTRTVTRTEDLTSPVLSVGQVKRCTTREKTWHTSELLREEHSDTTFVKRNRTLDGISSKMSGTDSSIKMSSWLGTQYNKRSASATPARSMPKAATFEQKEMPVTPLNMHSKEPFGLEVTFPRVGFAFRDSQGNMPIDDFDYDY